MPRPPCPPPPPRLRPPPPPPLQGCPAGFHLQHDKTLFKEVLEAFHGQLAQSPWRTTLTQEHVASTLNMPVRVYRAQCKRLGLQASCRQKSNPEQVKIRKNEYQKTHNKLKKECMRLEQYDGHPLWKDSELIGLNLKCVERSLSLPEIQLTPCILLPNFTAADANNQFPLGRMLQELQLQQEDFAATRRVLLAHTGRGLLAQPSDFHRLAVGANVQKRFIPNILAEPDHSTVKPKSPCTFQLEIDSAMYAGFIPERLHPSVVLLMEDIRQHTTKGKKEVLVQNDFKRRGKTTEQLAKVRNAAANKDIVERGALKSILPVSVRRLLATVYFPNIQKHISTAALRGACKAAQRSTMFRLTRCSRCCIWISVSPIHTHTQSHSLSLS